MCESSKYNRRHRLFACVCLLMLIFVPACAKIKSAHTFSRDYKYRQVPSDPPGVNECVKYDEITHGGQLFKQYCGSCHNARALGERPFSNYEVAFAHMRRHAYLTGDEYRRLIHFLRRWHDLGPATPDIEPAPKRMFFSQPIAELRPQKDEE